MAAATLVRTILPAAIGVLVFGASQPETGTWDALLKRYVTPESRVDYRIWRQDGIEALDAWVQTIARPWPENLSQAARKAELINAYNALTIHWLLHNYPVSSIWRTVHPFTEKRHTLGGRKVSLDDIENELRAMNDPRIHAALVCGARSCPPLRREAYVAERIDAQLDDNVRAWLHNPALNEFFPDKQTIEISEIFKWYKTDFDTSAKSVPAFLARFAGLPAGKLTIRYKTYNWGLNDAGNMGADYTRVQYYRDYFRNKF